MEVTIPIQVTTLRIQFTEEFVFWRVVLAVTLVHKFGRSGEETSVDLVVVGQVDYAEVVAEDIPGVELEGIIQEPHLEAAAVPTTLGPIKLTLQEQMPVTAR